RRIVSSRSSPGSSSTTSSRALRFTWEGGVTIARGRGTAFNDRPLDFFDRIQLLLGLGESAAESSIFLELGLHAFIRVCLRPAAVVECLQQPTILGFELQAYICFMQENGGERALLLRHAFGRRKQRFQQAFALTRARCRMRGRHERGGIPKRARRRRCAREVLFDFVED